MKSTVLLLFRNRNRKFIKFVIIGSVAIILCAVFGGSLSSVWIFEHWNKNETNQFELEFNRKLHETLNETSTGAGIKSQNNNDCNTNQRNSSRQVPYTEILNALETNPRGICNCSWISPFLRKNGDGKSRGGSVRIESDSSCSLEATLSGPFQKVLSYSLFPPPKKATTKPGTGKLRYFEDISQNLLGMLKFYPGWVMRIYSNLPLEDEICHIICSSSDIFFCDVSQLPGIGDVRGLHPMTWRFLLIGDGSVEKFGVRDLDSRLSQRERDAVAEWETTSFPIHGMRDNPVHETEMMGGMWGADNYKLCLETGRKILNQINSPIWKWIYNYNDQQIIAKVIYYKYEKHILTHDSYLCELFQDSLPFPTRRQNNIEFVGLTHAPNYKLPLPSPCPVQCRPENGSHWDYC